MVLANPNAPTGIALGLDSIERVLTQNANSVVIVDEAYAAFGAQSAAALIGRYPNLLVVCTLSKSHALAGLRVGYALGQPHLIEGLERIKDSFNSYPLDMAAQAVAAAALLDTEYAGQIAQRIIRTREHTAQRLSALGFSALPSRANFLFVTRADLDAARLKAFLEQGGIYVRHFDKPRISQHLRITIGTDAQMDALLQRISEFR